MVPLVAEAFGSATCLSTSPSMLQAERWMFLLCLNETISHLLGASFKETYHPYHAIWQEITTRDHELLLNRQEGRAHFSTMVEVE